MNGNIGKKARAAFLALIMITSVMAAGVAFSGSAAALEDPSNEGEFAQIVVLPGDGADGVAEANKEADAIQATTVINGSSSINGENIDQVTIDFGEDLDLGDSSDSGSAISGTSDVTVEIISPDGGTQNADVTSGDGSVSADGQSVDITSLDSASATLNNGDKVRVTLGNTGSGGTFVNLPSGDIDDVSIGVNSTNTDQTITAPFEVPGPVEVELADGTTTQYSEITTALNQNSSDFSTNEEDIITVEDGLFDEASTISPGAENVTIQAASGAEPRVITDNEASSNQIRINNDNVTVDGITFDPKFNSLRDEIDSKSRIIRVAASDVDLTDVTVNNTARFTGASDIQHLVFQSAGDNLTISNSRIQLNADSDGTRILDSSMVASDGGGDDLEISNSEIIETRLDGQEEDDFALAVGAGNDADQGPAVIDGNIINAGGGINVAIKNAEVTNNDVTTTSTSNNAGLEVLDTANDNIADGLTVSGNDFTSENGGTALSIAQSGGLDIEDGTITGYDTGVSIGAGTTNDVGNINVTGTEFVNSSSNAIDIVDADGYEAGAEINIDGVTISDGVSSTSTGINIVADSDNDLASVDVTNADIQGPQTDTGIVVDTSTAYDVNITDSQFVNASTGLQITNYDVGPSNGQFNVHFNTFEENDAGVATAGTPISAGNSGQVLNLTFNDFVDNANNALDTSAGSGVPNGQINANYSWWDNRDSSRIVGPYTPQNAGSQLPSPRRVYSYTRLHTGGQP